LPGDICLERPTVAGSRRTKFVQQTLCRGIAIQIHHTNARARRSERVADPAAKPAGSAGYQHNGFR
jgi:hypothetical protein